MKSNCLILISQDRFILALEAHTFTGCSRSLLGQIVNTKYHILRRNGYRTTIRRFQ